MYGFQVYETEVDDRGIDFITRHENGPFIEVQVKSIRSYGYVFLEKKKFMPKEYLYLALVIFTEGHLPELYLVPSIIWRNPDTFFVSRDYEGLKSKPEWGLNISKKNIVLLEPYRFKRTVEDLINNKALLI